ncbi:cbb3-type cytochrome c oxidase subunit I [Halocatena pleomorpha]|uniref:Cytochrome-c oxidase n=1 Tax=Halocatena pleomorpha TaxID=1785090 RepID=A0A3P3RJI0_9EURY|nr:cbb3-type cytochrome c oxidase subunit I [Halocatena pleomorpha]RRJ33078.1 cytochrome-c oxidase [Halocatena pleomorpha]
MLPTVPFSGLVLVGGLLLAVAVVFTLRNGWPPTLALPDGGHFVGGEEAEQLETEKPGGVFRWFTTVDHKDIGLLYIVFATATALWGGTDAMMIRTELLTSTAGPWDPVTYNALFTTHGLTMLLFFVTPAFFGVGNYFLPLLLGADDMAYPRINAIAFWVLPPAYLLVRAGLITEVVAKAFAAIDIQLTSLFALTPPATGWTMYAPLSVEMVNPQIDLLLLGLHLSGIATTLGAINFLVTIFTERAADVTWARLDIFSWTMLTTSGLILFAFPLLGSALIMLLLDRNFGTTFFVVDGGGPLLWQHLFWFFGHPEVYILVLPAFGLVSLILPKFSGRKLFGFKFIVYSTLAIGVLSFGVWAHHMFTTGIDPRVRLSFMAVSLAIAIPSAVKTFNWMTTMWDGHVRLTAPMLFCVAGVGMFIIGGVTGVFLASIPVDMLVHDTYYVVGHFHFIVMGIITFAAFSASYYWYPILTGRMYDTLLAKVHAWLSIVGVITTFGPMLIIGMDGMPRRYATYPSKFVELQQVASVGAFILFTGVILWLYNMIQSYRIGPVVLDADVWNLKPIDQFTPEWQWFEERLEERRQRFRNE